MYQRGDDEPTRGVVFFYCSRLKSGETYVRNYERCGDRYESVYQKIFQYIHWRAPNRFECSIHYTNPGEYNSDMTVIIFRKNWIAVLNSIVIPKDAPVRANDNVPNEILCSICLENIRDTVILDCKHLSTCTTCFQKIVRTAIDQAQYPECPMCRCQIKEGGLKVFL